MMCDVITSSCSMYISNDLNITGGHKWLLGVIFKWSNYYIFTANFIYICNITSTSITILKNTPTNLDYSLGLLYSDSQYIQTIFYQQNTNILYRFSKC